MTGINDNAYAVLAKRSYSGYRTGFTITVGSSTQPIDYPLCSLDVAHLYNHQATLVLTSQGIIHLIDKTRLNVSAVDASEGIRESHDAMCGDILFQSSTRLRDANIEFTGTKISSGGCERVFNMKEPGWKGWSYRRMMLGLARTGVVVGSVACFDSIAELSHKILVDRGRTRKIAPSFVWTYGVMSATHPTSSVLTFTRRDPKHMAYFFDVRREKYLAELAYNTGRNAFIDLHTCEITSCFQAGTPTYVMRDQKKTGGHVWNLVL
jgi:hypothetical protein